MNTVILMGRLTSDPVVSRPNSDIVVAKYTLAVDRNSKDEGADFIRCVAFGKRAEFTEKYLNKGMKIVINGHIKTGSYEDNNGRKVYTTDVIVDSQEFCERKGESAPAPATPEETQAFMNIPEGFEEELPF